MHDKIDEKLRQAEAKLAEIKASPQGQKLAAWDEGVGRFIGIVKAAAWVMAACFAGMATWLVMQAVAGPYALAAAAIGAALIALALWRAWKAASQTRTVSEMLTEEATSRLAPARMALRLARKAR